MGLVTWNDSYSVNVTSCDDDHKRLFAIINELHDAMKVGKGSQAIENSVRELVEYTRYHFTREEALLEKARYAELSQHGAQHRVFVSKIEEFQREINEGKTMQSNAVVTFLRDWLSITSRRPTNVTQRISARAAYRSLIKPG